MKKEGKSDDDAVVDNTSIDYSSSMCTMWRATEPTPIRKVQNKSRDYL